jgi:redox-sensing transcriptional repressor
MPREGEDMNDSSVPDIVVGRLPLYLRAIQSMRQEGQQVTSSQDLGKVLGISAAQIRKDLSQFGEFGKQGTGYNIEYLCEQLQKILKVDKVWDVAVIGAGDIGSALARYQGFTNRGFQVTLVFDSNPQKIGQQESTHIIQESAKMVGSIKEAGVKIAMIAVPADQAQKVADQLIEAGVKAILNYAPTSISVPKDTCLQYIDPATHLQHMTYYL